MPSGVWIFFIHGADFFGCFVFYMSDRRDVWRGVRFIGRTVTMQEGQMKRRAAGLLQVFYDLFFFFRFIEKIFVEKAMGAQSGQGGQMLGLENLSFLIPPQKKTPQVFENILDFPIWKRQFFEPLKKKFILKRALEIAP